jgi:hypothetical protein
LLWVLSEFWMPLFKTLERLTVARLTLGVSQSRQLIAAVMLLMTSTAGNLRGWMGRNAGVGGMGVEALGAADSLGDLRELMGADIVRIQSMLSAEGFFVTLHAQLGLARPGFGVARKKAADPAYSRLILGLVAGRTACSNIQ